MDAANTNYRREPEFLGIRPTAAQREWLARGVDQPGGKLPLFDHHGKRVSARTIRPCIEQGWAEPWFINPIKPDWLVCKLTERGREILALVD
ncbi:MAG: hypothetical protein RL477_744 [Pseudomonadota bacterium]|jgi:hypothetical protein